ncbi:MAG: S41 family peptidase [Bacteroidota bacterium]
MQNQKPKYNPFYPIFFAIVLLIGVFIGNNLKPVFPRNEDNKINDIIRYIEENYVDTVNRQKLTELAISGMLQSLDPHSVFIPAVEFNSANDVLVGNFEGIGVQFNILNDTIMVVNTVSNGPSEKAGIRAGDRIVKVDGKKVAGIKITNADVMHLLKGEKGSKVKVGILRRGVASLLEFNITRDVIPTYSVDFSYMVNKNIGYIKISSFSGTTHEEFIKAMQKLKSQGLNKLIIDLRGNAGGYLETAIKIADELLPDKKEIVYTEGAHHKREYAYAKGDGAFETNELIILIDEWSASASEILAGAIQDNDRGLIVGRRSFGKGLVQEQIKLKDGSAFRLTIARYYTPTGRCIQKSYQNGVDDYYNEFMMRVMSPKDGADTLPVPDSLKFKTPKGKIVYGGGGITPDVQVGQEVEGISPYFNLVSNKGYLFQFALDYADKHRAAIRQQYKTPVQFINGFIVSADIFNDFIAYSKQKGVAENQKEIALSQNLIKNRIKAYIGRNLYEEAGFYPIILTTDKTFLEAIELLIDK